MGGGGAVQKISAVSSLRICHLRILISGRFCHFLYDI